MKMVISVDSNFVYAIYVSSTIMVVPRSLFGLVGSANFELQVVVRVLTKET